MTISDVFRKFAETIPCEISVAELLGALPPTLADLPVDPRENIFEIRYTFAEPFKTGGNVFAIGTPQLPEVIYLYLAVVITLRHMTTVDRTSFLSKIAIPGKHLDALSEIRPVLTAWQPKTIEYEVPGKGQKTIDWKFNFAEKSILLDVKNRSGSTYQHLKDIVLSNKSGSIEVPKPRTNAPGFFKGAAEKFAKDRKENSLHGVWIISGIRENEAELTNYFDSDESCQSLDFFIISGWNHEAYLHTKASTDRTQVCKLFQIVESRNHVF